jgi:hypothetical protein
MTNQKHTMDWIVVIENSRRSSGLADRCWVHNGVNPGYWPQSTGISDGFKITSSTYKMDKRPLKIVIN